MSDLHFGGGSLPVTWNGSCLCCPAVRLVVDASRMVAEGIAGKQREGRCAGWLRIMCKWTSTLIMAYASQGGHYARRSGIGYIENVYELVAFPRERPTSSASAITANIPPPPRTKTAIRYYSLHQTNKKKTKPRYHQVAHPQWSQDHDYAPVHSEQQCSYQMKKRRDIMSEIIGVEQSPKPKEMRKTDFVE